MTPQDAFQILDSYKAALRGTELGEAINVACKWRHQTSGFEMRVRNFLSAASAFIEQTEKADVNPNPEPRT